MYKYYKYALITIICCIYAASFASGSIQKTTNNFNFKNISAQKNYSALDYGEYDPAKAIDACTTSQDKIPVDSPIWPADPSNPFPSPEPTASDCEMSSQMAYGCTDYTVGSIGNALSKSVVGIMRKDYDNKNSFSRVCTGTIIDNQWVLTAAHCVVNKYDNKLVSASSIMVAPWQNILLQRYGTPLTLYLDSLGSLKTFKVRAVSIKRHYPTEHEDSGDLALLKIDPITPDMGLEPITLANTSVLNEPETPVITAGYGRNEYQERDWKLKYRKSYYMTNGYDNNWQGGIYARKGNIYILDSKPIDYKGVKSAWSFNGPGDSGGPVLSYNSLTNKFQVEGVYSAGFFCDYVGYFAKLPYPYSRAASTTYRKNYDFIKSVMNGTPKLSEVKCRGECYLKSLYVINETSNNIYNYVFEDDHSLSYDEKTEPRIGVSQIAFNPSKDLAFAVNTISNSISKYIVLKRTGNLLDDQTIYLPPNYSSPRDITFISSKYMVVLATDIASRHYSLLQYDIRRIPGITTIIYNVRFLKAQPTLDNATHLNVTMVDHHKYLLVNNEEEIGMYKYGNNMPTPINYSDKIELTSDMGKLIEIKPFGDPDKSKLYALTTKGVYIYQLNYNYITDHINFTRIGNLFSNFATDSHIVPLYENSFAISKRGSNSVLIYEVSSPDNTITLENHITIPDPSGMEFDDGVLYITSFPRSLYSYKISYPLLTVSTKPQILQTGEGPTGVEIGRRSYR